MTEETRKKINYTVVCVNEFARKKAIQAKDAFFYLARYKGIAFLEEHYEIEHTLSFEEVMEDLERICAKNGGKLN